jgi:hypothetical protein
LYLKLLTVARHTQALTVARRTQVLAPAAPGRRRERFVPFGEAEGAFFEGGIEFLKSFSVGLSTDLSEELLSNLSCLKTSVEYWAHNLEYDT